MSENQPNKLNKEADQSKSIRKRLWDIGGILWIALGLMTLLTYLFPDIGGNVLGWWAEFLDRWFGWGSLWVVLTLCLVGIWMIGKFHRRKIIISWGRVIAFEIAAFSSMAILAFAGGRSLEQAETGYGGRIGWGLEELMFGLFKPLGFAAGFLTILSLGIILFICLLYGFGLNRSFFIKIRYFVDQTQRDIIPESVSDPAVSEAPLRGSESLNSPGVGAQNNGGRKKIAKVSLKSLEDSS